MALDYLKEYYQIIGASIPEASNEFDSSVLSDLNEELGIALDKLYPIIEDMKSKGINPQIACALACKTVDNRIQPENEEKDEIKPEIKEHAKKLLDEIRIRNDYIEMPNKEKWLKALEYDIKRISGAEHCPVENITYEVLLDYDPSIRCYGMNI